MTDREAIVRTLEIFLANWPDAVELEDLLQELLDDEITRN
jgi:hypothetical protein